MDVYRVGSINKAQKNSLEKILAAAAYLNALKPVMSRPVISK